jgi:hypothetical protein
METIVSLLASDRVAYVDPGLGGVQLEFLGRASAANMREWLADDFNVLHQPSPPWS